MKNRRMIIGPILVFVGFIMLAKSFDLFFFSFGDFIGFFFPAALIAIGLWLVTRHRAREKASEAGFQYYQQEGPADSPYDRDPDSTGSTGSASSAGSTGSADSTSSDVPPGGGQRYSRASESPQPSPAGKLKYSKFLGDMYIDCAGLDLQNAEVTSFLGDTEIKLHGGRLSPGLNRMIISGFIGDVRVLVPQGMAVFSQSSNFIGDIEMMGRRSSGFGNSVDSQTPNYAEAKSKLYIATNHFIGDVRIYVV